MSNARNLANLLGTSTTVPTSKQPAGSVLQVVQAVKTDTQTFNANTYSAISSLSAVITPTSTSSKILVQAVIHIGTSGGNEGVGGKLYRNSSEVTGARGVRTSACINHPGLLAAVATFSTASRLSGASPFLNAFS